MKVYHCCPQVHFSPYSLVEWVYVGLRSCRIISKDLVLEMNRL